eukprot:46560-Rhodomonas_salina.1
MAVQNWMSVPNWAYGGTELGVWRYQGGAVGSRSRSSPITTSERSRYHSRYHRRYRSGYRSTYRSEYCDSA